MLRETLLPNFDQTYSAFIEDLDARGLLDETLVVTMGEMGRTPKINANGGRDHWTYCYSVLLAGAGIRGGTIHGASDDQAAFIKDKPVHIRDICATIYHLLGIDPEMPVYDREPPHRRRPRRPGDQRDPGVTAWFNSIGQNVEALVRDAVRGGFRRRDRSSGSRDGVGLFIVSCWASWHSSLFTVTRRASEGDSGSCDLFALACASG